MARGRIKSEHAGALELISYGLAKFAGPTKGTNVIANYMAKNRSAFFKLLVDKGLVSSSNAASNRQDNYDPFFGTKIGYVADAKMKIYAPRKERLDSVLGHLSILLIILFIRKFIHSSTLDKIFNSIIFQKVLFYSFEYFLFFFMKNVAKKFRKNIEY